MAWAQFNSQTGLTHTTVFNSLTNRRFKIFSTLLLGKHNIGEKESKQREPVKLSRNEASAQQNATTYGKKYLPMEPRELTQGFGA